MMRGIFAFAIGYAVGTAAVHLGRYFAWPTWLVIATALAASFAIDVAVF